MKLFTAENLVAIKRTQAHKKIKDIDHLKIRILVSSVVLCSQWKISLNQKVKFQVFCH